MRCARASVWLQLCVDGRLDLRRLAQLQEHLQTCGACRQDLPVLELVCQGASAAENLPEPQALTAAIMQRIAALEARRAHAAGRRFFHPVWGDAIRAAVLATVATAVFMMFQPALWRTASASLLPLLLPVERAATAFYDTWSMLLAWLVWVGVGALLAFWLAGGEVRAGWRRTLLARMPHV